MENFKCFQAALSDDNVYTLFTTIIQKAKKNVKADGKAEVEELEKKINHYHSTTAEDGNDENEIMSDTNVQAAPTSAKKPARGRAAAAKKAPAKKAAPKKSPRKSPARKSPGRPARGKRAPAKKKKQESSSEEDDEEFDDDSE